MLEESRPTRQWYVRGEHDASTQHIELRYSVKVCVSLRR